MDPWIYLKLLSVLYRRQLFQIPWSSIMIVIEIVNQPIPFAAQHKSFVQAILLQEEPLLNAEYCRSNT